MTTRFAAQLFCWASVNSADGSNPNVRWNRLALCYDLEPSDWPLCWTANSDQLVQLFFWKTRRDQVEWRKSGLGRTRADHGPLFAGWYTRRVEGKEVACLEKYTASLGVKEYRAIRSERGFQSASLAVMPDGGSPSLESSTK